MMSLGRILAHLYPEADDSRDYIVRTAEDGEAYIAEWNLDAPQPTEAELEAARLEAAKAARTDEFAARAIDDLAPLFTDGQGRDETMLLLAGHLLKLCEALLVAPDPRLRTVVDTGQKALQKKAEVEGAGSVEEVEAVEWT